MNNLWWIFILLVPILRLWWDSQSAKRIRKDKNSMKPWDAQAAEFKRTSMANITAISATAILTILGMSGAYKVDREHREALAKLGLEIQLVQKEASESASSVSEKLVTHLLEYSSFQKDLARIEDVNKLERCTAQWIEKLTDRDIAVEEGCFPSIVK